jgi:type II secretory pathway pseudopilin PulG
MDTVAKREYLVLVVLVVILLASLYPALMHMRREARDGIRRNELVALKRQMEQHNNELGHYPTQFDAVPHRYVVLEQDGDKAVAWYIRAELENAPQPTAGFNEEHNVFYQVVRGGDRTFYDICGGEYQCGVTREER